MRGRRNGYRERRDDLEEVDVDARIHAVIDVPPTRHAAAGRFWDQALGWPLGAPWPRHPELQSFEPPDGRPYVHLQSVDAPARVHLDVGVPDPGATVRRAVALGAEMVAEHDDWTTLTSPGGLPVCLFDSTDGEMPEPVGWPEGHRSRLVQVCVDAPLERVETEVAFWRGLLGGRWYSSSSPEFVGKWHADGSPLQLLFQRLDDPQDAVTAHLDTGTDDLDAEVRRLVALGAEDVARGRGWHVLRDPSGLSFCVTENSPESPLVRDLG